MVDENKTPSVSVAGKYFLLSQEQIAAHCSMFDHNYILLDENIQFSWEDEIFLMRSYIPASRGWHMVVVQWMLCVCQDVKARRLFWFKQFPCGWNHSVRLAYWHFVALFVIASFAAITWPGSVWLMSSKSWACQVPLVKQEITLVNPGLLGDVQLGQRQDKKTTPSFLWGTRSLCPGVWSDHLQQGQLTRVSQQPVPERATVGADTGLSSQDQNKCLSVPCPFPVFGCLDVLCMHSRMPGHCGDIWLPVAFSHSALAG